MGIQVFKAEKQFLTAEKLSETMVSEVGGDDKAETTQELDLLQLELDDTDFVDFLVEWGSNSPMTDNSTDLPSTEGTKTKARSGKRKNVMVVTETSSNGQPPKRSKKSTKPRHSSGDGISILSSSSGVQEEATETAECSAHMAAAGTYNPILTLIFPPSLPKHIQNVPLSQPWTYSYHYYSIEQRENNSGRSDQRSRNLL